MVDALVSVAAENLLKLAGYEARLLTGVRKELEDLSGELRTIRAVLQDAEMRQIRDEAVRIWLRKLKYVAYDIEDMVEAWDQALPDGILGMGSLRHLDVFQCSRLKKLPDGIGRLTLLQTLGMFPVAVALGGRSNIGELAGLNQLRGRLFITNLGAVGSVEEACTAKIQDKTSLMNISLDWGSGERPHPVAEGVLESLRPPFTLEALWIDNYPSRAFPSWVGDASFLHLSQVELRVCKNCTQLPPLGQLPCLKRLRIWKLPGLKKVGEEFLHLGTSIDAFPQLESLSFSFMDRWEDWASPLLAANANATIFPRLRELSLHTCPKLEGVPHIFTTALQTLYITDCPALPSLQFLPRSIQSLELGGVSTGVLLPLAIHHLSTLQSLRISSCKNLRTLPEGLTGLTNLQKLEINGCRPELSEGCKVGGRIWPRIAHIPRIEIDYEEVQNNPR